MLIEYKVEKRKKKKLKKVKYGPRLVWVTLLCATYFFGVKRKQREPLNTETNLGHARREITYYITAIKGQHNCVATRDSGHFCVVER